MNTRGTLARPWVQRCLWVHLPYMILYTSDFHVRTCPRVLDSFGCPKNSERGIRSSKSEAAFKDSSLAMTSVGLRYDSTLCLLGRGMEFEQGKSEGARHSTISDIPGIRS